MGEITLALALAPVLTTDEPAQAQRAQAVYVQQGLASWYGPGFDGRTTASGERFNQYELTAAHKKLPLGTKATVTNSRTARQLRSRSTTADRMSVDAFSICPRPPRTSSA